MLGAAGAGTLGLLPVRGVRSSSGELRILHWSDQLPFPIIFDFERETGIKVIATPFSDSVAQNALLQDGTGRYDLCQPMQHLAPQFREAKLLDALDIRRLANLDNIFPAMLQDAKNTWTWDRGYHFVPHCWGCEGISWRTDLAELDRDMVSYATLWQDEFKGKVQAHPESLLLSIGLWLDYTGRVPSNRMADAFRDPDSMRSIYDAIAAVASEKKPWIAKYWSGPYEIRSNLQSGATIGQTWDGPARSLKKEGKPVDFVAPLEGAIAWTSGWSMTAQAENREQAYAWLNYLATPDVAAKLAEGSSYNAVVNGTTPRLSEWARRNFTEAFPGDSLDRLWYRIEEQVWFAALRTEYLRKIEAS